MTLDPNIARHAHRRAAALLLAAVALPSTAYAQETVTPPTVLAPTQPAPAPVPPVAAQPGQSRTTIAPGVVEAAQQEASERAAEQRAERDTARPQQRAARTAPVARRAAVTTVAPATVTSAETAAPVETAPVTPEPVAPAVTAQSPAETVAPATTETTEAAVAPEAAATGSSLWLILAGLGLAAAAIAAFLLLRRRRDDDPVQDTYATDVYEPAARPVVPPVDNEGIIEPDRVIEPDDVAPRIADPIAAAPVFIQRPPIAESRVTEIGNRDDIDETVEAQPALENAVMVTPDAADIAAVLGGEKPSGNRPQLELAMRPTRAGMSHRGAMIEFELTVANSGGMPAEDVRIGAFMLGGGLAQDAEIERLLVDLPANSVMPSERIEPGDGRRLDASVTLPRDHVDASMGDGISQFTPILVADARYRMADGTEGRTAAAFTIGRVDGSDQFTPIAVQDDPAMYADIEARLHSVPAKV